MQVKNAQKSKKNEKNSLLNPLQRFTLNHIDKKSSFFKKKTLFTLKKYKKILYINKKGEKMFSLILSSLIITAEPNEPTKIIGSANTPEGQRKEVIVEQPYNSPNPFGYIAPENNTTIQNTNNAQTPPQQTSAPNMITTQSSSVNPRDMNPLHYKDKIENTIYQSGDRLIIIQSIPLKYIKEALEPNIQPTISDFPAW